MQFDANFSSKWLNYTNIKFDDQIEIIFFKSLLQSTIIYERVNSDFMQNENTTITSYSSRALPHVKYFLY